MDRRQEITASLDQIYLYVSVNEVFDDLQPTVESLADILRELPLDETLLWCGRCNSVLTGLGTQTIFEKQQTLLANLLQPEAIARVNTVAFDLGTLRYTRRVMPFSRGQMLELARWATLFSPRTPEPTEAFRDREVRQRFAAAAFIAGELLTRRLGERRLIVRDNEELFPDDSLAFTVGAARATQSASQPWRVLGRGFVILNEYLPKYDRDLSERLYSKIGLTTDEYLLCLAALVPTFLWLGTRGSFIDLNRIGEVEEFRNVFRVFAESQSQTSDDLKASLWGSDGTRSPEDPRSWSLQPFRQRPIIRSTWEQAVISDGLIWEEKAAVGAIFDSIKGEGSNVSRHVLGAFGYAFEDYASDLLEECLAAEEGFEACDFLRGVEGDLPSEEHFEIDVAYQQKRQLYLFEIKATFLREDQLHDPEQFLAHIDAKYVERAGTDNETHRAIEQLATLSRSIATQEWQGEDGEYSEIQLIHPILVVYDSALSSPKIGEDLAEKLCEAVEPDDIHESGQMRKGVARIAQLTILSAHDLENLQDSVKYFSLLRLISEYQRNCPSRFISVHDYIWHSRFKHMLQPNKKLAEKAKEVLTQIGLTAFGRDVVADSQRDAES